MIQLSAGGLVFANEIANEPCDTRWYSTTRNGRGSTQILDCQALMITAQHDGRPTFNPQVVGSIPTGPTKLGSIPETPTTSGLEFLGLTPILTPTGIQIPCYRLSVGPTTERKSVLFFCEICGTSLAAPIPGRGYQREGGCST